MIKKCMLVAALAAVPVVSVAADSSAQQQNATAAATPQVSQERIARIRQSLVAQMAAYDAAERAMRTPTAQERAALALPTGKSTTTVVKMPNGGFALQGD